MLPFFLSCSYGLLKTRNFMGNLVSAQRHRLTEQLAEVASS